MREKSGKALIYKGFEDTGRNEREKRNVTFTLHLLYVWARFERCLRVLLYIGVENVMFWAVLMAVWGISWASGRV